MRRTNSISSLVVGEQLQFSSRKPPVEERLLLEYNIGLSDYRITGALVLNVL
jgi:hypothetical protein